MIKLNLVEFSSVTLEDFKKCSIGDLNFDTYNTIFVTDEDRVGVITDGDVRRAVRKFGYSFSPCNAINWNPEIFYAPEGITEKAISEECRKILDARPEIKIIPVRVGKVFKMCAFKDSEIVQSDVTVVIMAGGLGTRLGEMTKTVPKPMLKLGSKPILEHIVENLVSEGYINILISVNHLKEQIIEYFGSGSSHQCSIGYLVENEPLGTIGCLQLRKIETKYIFLCNGDLFTNFEVQQLHAYTETKKANFVIATTSFSSQIPYGVIEYDGDTNHVVAVNEKPTLHFSVAAGQYFFESTLLSYLGEGYVDAPDFIRNVVSKNYIVRTFSLLNRWIDIGFPEQLEEARGLVSND